MPSFWLSVKEQNSVTGDKTFSDIYAESSGLPGHKCLSKDDLERILGEGQMLTKGRFWGGGGQPISWSGVQIKSENRW